MSRAGQKPILKQRSSIASRAISFHLLLHPVASAESRHEPRANLDSPISRWRAYPDKRTDEEPVNGLLQSMPKDQSRNFPNAVCPRAPRAAFLPLSLVSGVLQVFPAPLVAPKALIPAVASPGTCRYRPEKGPFGLPGGHPSSREVPHAPPAPMRTDNGSRRQSHWAVAADEGRLEMLDCLRYPWPRRRARFGGSACRAGGLRAAR